MADPKLEAMLVMLLNLRGQNGKPWTAIRVPGHTRFTRADVEAALHRCRKKWWQFWR